MARSLTEPLPDHCHHLVASQRPSGGSQTAEAKPWSRQPFDPAVILLDDVVQVFALPQPREAPEFARSLHVRRGTRIGRVPVHCDRVRVDGMRLGQRLATEPLRRSGIPPRRQQEVDRLAQTIDRAIQVGLNALDLDIGLIHSPGSSAQAQMTPDPLLQFGSIGLLPTEQGGVIHRDATVGQHRRQLAIADREDQIPPQSPEDHLGCKMPPLEGAIPAHRRHPGSTKSARQRYIPSQPSCHLQQNPWCRGCYPS
jgi:hypothetical protein